MNLTIRLAAAAAAGVLAAGCGTAAGPPSASHPAAPRTSAPASAPAATAAPSPPPTLLPFGYQPLFPFASLAEAQAWQASYASGGHQPWHLDADQTALVFTQGYIGGGQLAGPGRWGEGPRSGGSIASGLRASGWPIVRVKESSARGQAARRRLMIMQAKVGDELTVRGRHQGDEDRHGKIIEIHGQDGSPPYLIRWRDDRESIFFPTSGYAVEHHPAGKPAR